MRDKTPTANEHIQKLSQQQKQNNNSFTQTSKCQTEQTKTTLLNSSQQKHAQTQAKTGTLLRKPPTHAQTT